MPHGRNDRPASQADSSGASGRGAARRSIWHRGPKRGMADMRAALYVRLSRDRDGLSTGPDRQLADCRTMAAARVWDVVGEFVDRDVSAYNPHTPRPAYEAM